MADTMNQELKRERAVRRRRRRRKQLDRVPNAAATRVDQYLEWSRRFRQSKRRQRLPTICAARRHHSLGKDGEKLLCRIGEVGSTKAGQWLEVGTLDGASQVDKLIASSGATQEPKRKVASGVRVASGDQQPIQTRSCRPDALTTLQETRHRLSSFGSP